MFTGIISDLGRIQEIVRRPGGDLRLVVAPGAPLQGVALGASIACNGVCLTVVEQGGADGATDWFAVDVSGETLSKTTLGSWTVGRLINLERPLRVGDELGGHFVTGHVDGLCHAVSATPDGESTRWRFRLPDAFAKFVAPKGSVALDGISLTVNEVAGPEFGVNIIPHTASVTTFQDLKAGDPLHFEIDVLARYMARMLSAE